MPRPSIEKVQASSRSDTPNKGDLFSVRQRIGPTRTTRSRDIGFGLARLKVQPLHDVDLSVGIPVVLKRVPRRDIFRIVEMLPIGSEDQFVDIFLICRFFAS